MATFRQRALDEAASHQTRRFYEETVPVSSYFGQNVLDLDKMRGYMSEQAFNAVQASVLHGAKLDRTLADEIAAGIKEWAIEMGATHYTHLFQPLTDSTAEKHEAFVSVKDGVAFEKFNGTALVQQEPDASSFPNGGLRNTFEARGYSAWDPSSPVFVMDGTLCIPSVFVSYTGETLDAKAPHLKSLSALSDAASSVARLFDENVKAVKVNLGIEQEYFLVDESLYNARPDLMLSGRTLIGHTSAKDQQLEDHYFGAIPSRVSSFMKDFETEAYKLGILLQTRHNEVAPNQFECAPMYCDATKAIDQNMMLMIVMQKVAEKHHLKVIFHEKPFDGVNGSGKHCNWSVVTDTGVNLLSPGKSPMKNLQFLSFYACVLHAVHRHHFLLMTSVATLSNSFRLGGGEAPPSVASVFSGSTLYGIFQSIMDMQDVQVKSNNQESIKIVNSLPEIFPDNTDRNRTSPFAFTGNKFEFRMVGSSTNIACPNFIINTIVAEELRVFADRLEKAKDFNGELNILIKETVKEHKRILFSGNNYSTEWQKEAKTRGLSNYKTTFDALPHYTDQKNIELFERHNILSEQEIHSRTEILLENYCNIIHIEALTAIDIARKEITPVVIDYQGFLLDELKLKKDYGQVSSVLEESILKEISELSEKFHYSLNKLIDDEKKYKTTWNNYTKAKYCKTTLLKDMEEVRKYADQMELLIGKDFYAFPTYEDILYSVKY